MYCIFFVLVFVVCLLFCIFYRKYQRFWIFDLVDRNELEFFQVTFYVVLYINEFLNDVLGWEYGLEMESVVYKRGFRFSFIN